MLKEGCLKHSILFCIPLSHLYITKRVLAKYQSAKIQTVKRAAFADSTQDRLVLMLVKLLEFSEKKMDTNYIQKVWEIIS